MVMKCSDTRVTVVNSEERERARLPRIASRLPRIASMACGNRAHANGHQPCRADSTDDAVRKTKISCSGTFAALPASPWHLPEEFASLMGPCLLA